MCVMLYACIYVCLDAILCSQLRAHGSADWVESAEHDDSVLARMWHLIEMTPKHSIRIDGWTCRLVFG